MVYREGDRYVYRASALGRADRCLLAARTGYTALPAPAYLAKAAEAGNRYEPIVKERLRKNGWRIGQEQRMIEIYVGDDAIIRGHLDAGFIIGPHEGFDWPTPPILEVKSMSDRVFKRWKKEYFEGFPSYGAQLTTYMHGTGRDIAVYAVVNRDTEELDILIAGPPMNFSELEAKVARIEAIARAGLDFPSCDDGSGYFCPYEFQCDRKDILFEEIESGTEVVLIRLANDYDEARRIEKEVRVQKKEAHDAILEALGDRERVMAGTWKIANTPMERRRLNTNDLEEFLSGHGKSLDDFQTKYPSSRLDVR